MDHSLIGAHLFAQAHDRLEQVMVAPHLIIQRIEAIGLGHRVQAPPPQVGPHEGGIFLLYKAIIVLVIRAGATQRQPGDFFAPEADKLVVQELAAIIGMQFAHGEREVCQNAPNAAFHRPLTAPEHSHAFAPAGRHINHLERVDVVALRLRTTVMHQIDFKMPGVASCHAIMRTGMPRATRLACSEPRQGKRGVSWPKRVSRSWTLATLM